MKRKNIKKNKKNNNSNLMLFQKATTKFTRECPLSGKDAPVINYKNLKFAKLYMCARNNSFMLMVAFI